MGEIVVVSPPNQSCLKTFNIFSLGRNRILNKELCDISLFANTRLMNDSDADFFSPNGQYHSFQGNSLSTDSMTDSISVAIVTFTSENELYVKGKFLNCCRNFYSGCLVENMWPIRESFFVSVDENNEDLVLRLKLWTVAIIAWSERQTIINNNLQQQVTISNPKLVLGNINSNPSPFFWIPLVGQHIDLTNGILINLTKNESLPITVVDPKLCLVRTRTNADDAINCGNNNNGSCGTNNNNNNHQNVVDCNTSCLSSFSPPPPVPSPPIPAHWNLHSDWFGLLREAAGLFQVPIGILAEPIVQGDSIITLLMTSDILLSYFSPYRTYLAIEELFYRVVTVEELNGNVVVKLEKPVCRNFTLQFLVRIINCDSHFQGTLNPQLNEICSAVCTFTKSLCNLPSSSLANSFSANSLANSSGSNLANLYNLKWIGGTKNSKRSGGGDLTTQQLLAKDLAEKQQTSSSSSLCSKGGPNLILMALNTITLPNLKVRCENVETKLSSFPVLLIDINDSQSNQVRFKPNIINNAGKIGNRFSFIANFDSEIGIGRRFVKYVGDFVSKPFPLDIDCQNLNVSIRNATNGSVIRFCEQDTRPPCPPLPRMQWTMEMRISSERCG